MLLARHDSVLDRWNHDGHQDACRAHTHAHMDSLSQASVSASDTEGSSIDGPAPPTTNDQVIMGSVTNQLASHTLKELILPLLR